MILPGARLALPLLLGFALACAAPAYRKPANPYPRLALADLFRYSSHGPGDELTHWDQVRKQRQNSSGREADLYERMLAFKARKKKAKGKLPREEFLREMSEILLEAARIWKHNPKVQRNTAGLMDMMAGMMQATLEPGARKRLGLGRKANRFSENYYRMYPDLPDANFAMGEVCLKRDPEDFECLKYLKRCRELDPADTECGKMHAEFTRAYSRPHCAGENMAALRVSAFVRADPKAAPPIFHDESGEAFRPASLPALDRRDIRGISRVDERVSALRFRPEGRKKLRRILNATGVTHMGLLQGEKLLLISPTYSVGVGNGVLEFQTPIAALCRETQTRKIPAKFRLKRR